MLNAITDGLAVVHSILGNDVDPGIALHVLAGEYPETRDLVSPVGLLAEILVDEASNSHVAASRDAERSAAIQSINAAIKRPHFRASRRTRKDNEVLRGPPTPIALEALISIAISSAMVPISRLPAPTIAAAHATLAAIDDMLEAVGVFDDEADDNVHVESVEQLNAAAEERFQQRVDQPLADWIGALTEQIELECPRPDAQAGKAEEAAACEAALTTT